MCGALWQRSVVAASPVGPRDASALTMRPFVPFTATNLGGAGEEEEEEDRDADASLCFHSAIFAVTFAQSHDSAFTR